MSSAANKDRSHLLLLTELLLFSIGLTGCLIMQVDRVQPAAYMDEIFHAPMAQKYCQGVFTEWDPKITTPPGLYALSSGLLRLASLVPLLGDTSAPQPDCSLFKLRLTNLFYFAVNFLAIYGILSSTRLYHNRPQSMPSPRIRVLKTLCLTLLPVSFFFVSLFYTDQASLACLLVAYFMQLNDHAFTAGLFGLLAIACRQTNAVWLLFLLGDSLEKAWLAKLKGLSKRLTEDNAEASVDSEASSLWDAASGILDNLPEFLNTVGRVVLSNWPLVASLAAFGAFVLANGGIVLGDKSAHEARIHAPQLMYFMAFAVAMHPAALIDLKLPRLRRILWAIPACVICCLAVKYQTFEHPYLLADNRHLTFYVWQRLFQRHWTVRYLLTPAYVACLWVYWQAMKHRSALFRLALVFCTALALVPASLIEPRYFIAPWTLWRLSAGRHDSLWRLLLEVVYFACVNAAVYWLFLKKPFLWPNVTQPQRFIW